MIDDVDAAGLLVGKTATFGGSASAFLFGLSANEVAAVVGALVAVIGLCVQVFYNRRRDRRETEEPPARTRSLAQRRARLPHWPWYWSPSRWCSCPRASSRAATNLRSAFRQPVSATRIATLSATMLRSDETS